MRKFLLLAFMFSISYLSLEAQDISNHKFGEVKISDFQLKNYGPDSNSDAIVLAETGYNKITGNGSSFTDTYYEHKRLRILDKNGFIHATVKIYLFKGETEAEKLNDVNAVVYNYDSGRVIKTVLDGGSIFTDKVNDNYTVKKFTLPDIKEGSIIEYEYSIKSPFYYIPRSWMFQDYFPKLYSEFYIIFPKEYVEITTTKFGFVAFDKDTAYNLKKGEIDEINEGTDIKNTGKNSRFYMGYWTMKDIPALKRENLISSLKNYRTRIEFTAEKLTGSGPAGNDFTTEWFRLVRGLTWTRSFAGLNEEDSTWLNKNIKQSITNTSDDRQRAVNIYEYIRDHFTGLGDGSVFLSKPLKKIFEDKSGTTADINLLLTASLRSLFLDAVPVLVSTRSNGKINTTYPQIDDYNYVVCRLKLGDTFINLDASKKMLGFGQLDKELYNGAALHTNPMQHAGENDNDKIDLFINFTPDSLKEVRITNVFIVNEEKNYISGNFAVQLGQQESLDAKQRLAGIKKDEFFDEIKKVFASETELSNTEIDSLYVPGEPITVKYDFKSELHDEDIIYFDPFIAIDKIENPLKAADRMFPVEMPYRKDEMYILNMEIPEGYKVDELPKSTKLLLNENEGSFEYLIGQSGNRIMLKYRLQLNKTIFEAKDYSIIREFFATITKKQNEQIVFKKTN